MGPGDTMLMQLRKVLFRLPHVDTRTAMQVPLGPVDDYVTTNTPLTTSQSHHSLLQRRLRPLLHASRIPSPLPPAPSSTHCPTNCTHVLQPCRRTWSCFTARLVITTPHTVHVYLRICLSLYLSLSLNLSCSKSLNFALRFIGISQHPLSLLAFAAPR
jgi:hypothetical protein